jgi:hypothetical protein
LLNPAIFVGLIETRVGIGLQRATKLLQTPLGMFAFTIWRVGKPHGRSGGVAGRTIIANVSPQAHRLGLAIPRRQHWHRRVVSVQFAGAHHVATQRFHQRL